MLLKRVLSSTVIILSVIIGISFKPVVLLVVLGLILSGLWEFFLMIEKKGVTLFKYFGLTLGALIPLMFYFQVVFTPQIQLLLILIALFMSFLFELLRKENHQVVLSMSATLFGVMYISWCFSFIIKIVNLYHGSFLLGFFLLVTKSQDIGAFFVGNKYGKRPFLKRVSPNKSLEGAIGGILASVGVAIVAGLILNNFISKGMRVHHLLFLGLILGIVSQLGDLFESLIKRDTGVKDSGTIIPGMGGVLDVIDSLIFAAPVFYFYVTMVLSRI
jgi:phosphatidate cytidylyltransferase